MRLEYYRIFSNYRSLPLRFRQWKTSENRLRFNEVTNVLKVIHGPTCYGPAREMCYGVKVCSVWSRMTRAPLTRQGSACCCSSAFRCRDNSEKVRHSAATASNQASTAASNRFDYTHRMDVRNTLRINVQIILLFTDDKKRKPKNVFKRVELWMKEANASILTRNLSWC